MSLDLAASLIEHVKPHYLSEAIASQVDSVLATIDRNLRRGLGMEIQHSDNCRFWKDTFCVYIDLTQISTNENFTIPEKFFLVKITRFRLMLRRRFDFYIQNSYSNPKIGTIRHW